MIPHYFTPVSGEWSNNGNSPVVSMRVNSPPRTSLEVSQWLHLILTGSCASNSKEIVLIRANTLGSLMVFTPTKNGRFQNDFSTMISKETPKRKESAVCD